MKLKTIAMTGVLSLAGLGLIGAGAHAAFTTNSTSAQTINAGTPGVALWAGNASNGCTTELIAQENATYCNSITLTAATVGSTFDANTTVGVVNVGSIPVSLTSFTVSDSPSVGYSLEDNMGICIAGVYGAGYYGSGYLTNAEAASPLAVSSTPLAVGSYTTYEVDLYAGEPSTAGCASIPALPPTAAGESDTVTLTGNYSG